MFGKKVTLFELLGFKVQVDVSWLLLAALVVWSLAEGVFPNMHEGLSTATYWLMAVLGTVGLFASLILHELSHSVVARRRGIPIRGITLFIFGGVAQMDEEPPSANTEMAMAIAGPIMSVLLAVGFYGLYLLLAQLDVGQASAAVPRYLALINLVLAGFNLLPAFPLDGGRVFRAILWRWKDNLRWATRVASQVGSGFGLALIGLGLLSVFAGSFVGGIWWFLIGMFLRGAANASYQQLLARQILEGEPVRRFMVENPITVPRDINLKQLVEEYSYKYHHDMFPVTEDSRLLGWVGTKHVKKIPRDRWSELKVDDVKEPCSDQNTVEVGTDSVRALAIMSRSGNGRLMVTEGGELVGVVALKDLLRFLSTKLDLEDVR